MWKAIENGNNRKIDGRFITVRKITTSWKEKNLYKKKGVQRSEVELLGAPIQTTTTVRDFRSYKEALIGASKVVVGSQQQKADESSCNGSEEQTNNVFRREVNFDLDFLTKKMEWIDGCAVGRLTSPGNLTSSSELLKRNSISCHVCHLGGLSVLLHFNNREEMVKSLSKDSMVLNEVFDNVRPWDRLKENRVFNFWVSLEEVHVLA
ncbi:hypothetical protein REPUB_Repub17cG0145500 [Reevesia pubescens]